jgi:membrane associated rhomboid family serine protease
VGASGAVTGIVYSSIILFPEMKLIMLFLPIPLPAYVFGICYLIYSIYGMNKNLGNIGHTAHFGGAIAGLLVTILIKPQIVDEKSLGNNTYDVPIAFLYYKFKKKNILINLGRVV